MSELSELLDYCDQYADSIFVRQKVEDKWGTYSLSEIPNTEKHRYIERWYLEGGLPVRVRGEEEQTNKGESKLGRDHNHYGFSVWMAGGGVKGGMTYGATDPFGFKAIEKPVHVHDLHATLLHLMGMDHERLTYRYASRDFRLTDVHGRVIRDILA